MGGCCIKRQIVIFKTINKSKIPTKNLSDTFLIQEKLGEGSFSEVYLAIYISCKKVKRAIKIIPYKYIDNTSQFLQELEILKSLDHPNIVKIYDYFKDNDNFYIVMDYLSGITLKNYIVKDENELILLLYKILCTTNYLHTLNICHRDLKPANIMFSGNSEFSEPVIIDFGLSKFSKNNKMFSYVGTPYYEAPEILNRTSYTSKVDIWSIGITFYQLITQKLPFKVNTLNELINFINTKKILYHKNEWCKYPPQLEMLIRQFLVISPNERISAGDSLKNQLFDVIIPHISVTLKKDYLFLLDIFSKVSYLTRIFLFSIVKNIKIEKISEIIKLFYFINQSKNGIISINELIIAFDNDSIKKLSYFNVNSIKKSFKFSEFVCFFMEKSHFLNDEDLLQISFKLLKPNNDKYINKEKIIEFMINSNITDFSQEEVVIELEKEKIDFEKFNFILDQL